MCPWIYRDMPRTSAGQPGSTAGWAQGQTPSTDSEAMLEVAEQELDLVAAKKMDE